MGGKGCARCGKDPTSTAVIGFSVDYAYLDVCEEHLADLLQNARPADGHDETSRRRRIDARLSSPESRLP